MERILIALGTFAFLSTARAQTPDAPAQAQNSEQISPKISEFCSNPWMYVCRNSKTKAQKKIYQKRITILENQIFDPPEPHATHDDLIRPILKMIGPASGAIHLWNLLDTARSAMVDSIGKKKKLNRQAGKFKNKLADAEIVTPHLFLSNELAVDHFIAMCGPASGKEGAYYLLDAEPWTNIVICPATYLAMAEPDLGIEPANVIESLELSKAFFILAHEMAHSIDYDHGAAPAYDDLLSCADLPGSPGDDVRATYSNEYIADYWAIEAMTRYLQGFQDKESILDFIVDAMGVACGGMRRVTSNLGGSWTLISDHPTQEVLFDDILGSNPRLRALMGCPALPLDAYCGL